MDKSNRTDIKKAILFIEELSWVLESRKGINLKKAISDLKELLNQQIKISSIADNYQSPNPNKHFLIGVLPKLFQDPYLFPTNESITNFATEVLKIKISRYTKRSKYELIGLIVCKTESLSDKNLSKLVTALSQITGNEDKLNKIRAEREKSNFSWNETIQKLTEKNR